MKRNLTFVLTMFILLLIVTSCSNNNSKEGADNMNYNSLRDNKEIEEIAFSFVKDLTNQNYKSAYQNYVFDEKMKNAISEVVLKSVMDQLTISMGSFKELGDTTKSAQNGYDIVSITTYYEKDKINLNVVFNEKKEIVGFNFSEASDNTKGSSENDKPENIVEYEVSVGEGEWQLPGTLTLPKGNGPFPVVVLVHGSGPNDRDETIGLNKPFRDIAWGLAEDGIAVLRYDKRTYVYSDKMISMYKDITVEEETIADAVAAVELVSNHEMIDSEKIFVLGHSLGGYLLPRIGLQTEDAAGYIILAGSTRPLEDIIVEQVEYLANLDGHISEEERQQIDALKNAQQKVKSPSLANNAAPQELMGINAKYWLDLRNYQPTEMVKELNQPILVLQGERDYQVTMEDFNNWKSALKDNEMAEFKSFEKLNHLFMTAEGTPNPNEYNNKGNVSEEAINYISQWIIK